VTGVAPFGLFVELVEHFVEGLVHVSSMSDDYYHYLDRAHQLRGENTHRTYRLGDHVRVRVARADLERRQVDLLLTDVLDRMRTQGTRGDRTHGASLTSRHESNTRVKKGKKEQRSDAGTSGAGTKGKGGTRRKATRPGRREREEARRDGGGRGSSRGKRRR
jgi:ribonuclease R